MAPDRAAAATTEMAATPETAAAGKERLRQEMRRRLARIDPREARRAADRLRDRVLNLPELERAEGVLVCLSFGGEVDTWNLVDQLVASGRRVFVPRAVRRTRRLHVHPYPCPLQTLPFGLSQPTAEAPELAADGVDSQVEAALVLALAFDRRGYRLGYGAGFFDRFLHGRPFPAVGLAYELQVVDRLPAEGHDVPMNRVVTESSTFPAL